MDQEKLLYDKVLSELLEKRENILRKKDKKIFSEVMRELTIKKYFIEELKNIEEHQRIQKDLITKLNRINSRFIEKMKLRNNESNEGDEGYDLLPCEKDKEDQIEIRIDSIDEYLCSKDVNTESMFKMSFIGNLSDKFKLVNLNIYPENYTNVFLISKYKLELFKENVFTYFKKRYGLICERGETSFNGDKISIFNVNQGWVFTERKLICDMTISDIYEF